MIEILRGFAAGYTAKVLIGLLIASFALWGVSGSILAGGNTVVQVGETKIDTYEFRFTYENQLNQLSQRLQQRLSRQQANAVGLQENVLAQVVSGAVLDENTKRMGLGLSGKNLAATLAEDPAFRDLSGQFSANLLSNYLRQTGISEKDFLADRKKIAMRNQIQEGTAASYDIPVAFVNAMAVYDKEKRIFDYAVVGPDALEKTPEPTDAEISKYYDENKSDFRAPEFRKVTILSLQAKDLSKPQEVSEEDLLATYESRKTNLETPERRRVEQLVLANQEEADSVSQKLADGKTFDEVLTELGKKPSDLNLGLLRQSDLPDESIRIAAFSAELNKPTASVQGAFGPVILRITAIEEAKTTPFEDVKDDLRNELALQRGGEEVFAQYDLIEDERAAGTTVKDTAERLELHTRTISAIDAQGLDKDGNAISDLPVAQQLIQALFQSEPGDDTQALPIGSDGYVWYEVDEIIPDRQKELDEVRDEVSAAWVNAETNSQVQTIAEEIAEKLKNGQDFNTVLAASLKADSLGQNVSYKTSDALERDAQASALTRAAIQTGFSAKVGSIEVVPDTGNKHIVLRVSKIEEPSDKTIDEAATEQIGILAANDILNQVVQDLQSREDVSVNRAAIEQAYTVGQGGQY